MKPQFLIVLTLLTLLSYVQNVSTTAEFIEKFTGNNTVVLEEDFSLYGGSNYPFFTVQNNSNITLDLNGHTLKAIVSQNMAAFTIEPKGILNVINSGSTKARIIADEQYYSSNYQYSTFFLVKGKLNILNSGKKKIIFGDSGEPDEEDEGAEEGTTTPINPYSVINTTTFKENNAEIVIKGNLEFYSSYVEFGIANYDSAYNIEIDDIIPTDIQMPEDLEDYIDDNGCYRRNLEQKNSKRKLQYYNPTSVNLLKSFKKLEIDAGTDEIIMGNGNNYYSLFIVSVKNEDESNDVTVKGKIKIKTNPTYQAKGILAVNITSFYIEGDIEISYLEDQIISNSYYAQMCSFEFKKVDSITMKGNYSLVGYAYGAIRIFESSSVDLSGNFTLNSQGARQNTGNYYYYYYSSGINITYGGNITMNGAFTINAEAGIAIRFAENVLIAGTFYHKTASINSSNWYSYSIPVAYVKNLELNGNFTSITPGGGIYTSDELNLFRCQTGTFSNYTTTFKKYLIQNLTLKGNFNFTTHWEAVYADYVNNTYFLGTFDFKFLENNSDSRQSSAIYLYTINNTVIANITITGFQSTCSLFAGYYFSSGESEYSGGEGGGKFNPYTTRRLQEKKFRARKLENYPTDFPSLYIFGNENGEENSIISDENTCLCINYEKIFIDRKVHIQGNPAIDFISQVPYNKIIIDSKAVRIRNSISDSEVLFQYLFKEKLILDASDSITDLSYLPDYFVYYENYYHDLDGDYISYAIKCGKDLNSVTTRRRQLTNRNLEVLYSQDIKVCPTNALNFTKINNDALSTSLPTDIYTLDSSFVQSSFNPISGISQEGTSLYYENNVLVKINSTKELKEIKLVNAQTGNTESVLTRESKDLFLTYQEGIYYHYMTQIKRDSNLNGEYYVKGKVTDEATGEDHEYIYFSKKVNITQEPVIDYIKINGINYEINDFGKTVYLPKELDIDTIQLHFTPEIKQEDFNISYDESIAQFTVSFLNSLYTLKAQNPLEQGITINATHQTDELNQHELNIILFSMEEVTPQEIKLDEVEEEKIKISIKYDLKKNQDIQISEINLINLNTEGKNINFVFQAAFKENFELEVDKNNDNLVGNYAIQTKFTDSNLDYINYKKTVTFNYSPLEIKKIFLDDKEFAPTDSLHYAKGEKLENIKIEFSANTQSRIEKYGTVSFPMLTESDQVTLSYNKIVDGDISFSLQDKKSINEEGETVKFDFLVRSIGMSDALKEVDINKVIESNSITVEENSLYTFATLPLKLSLEASKTYSLSLISIPEETINQIAESTNSYDLYISQVEEKTPTTSNVNFKLFTSEGLEVSLDINDTIILTQPITGVKNKKQLSNYDKDDVKFNKRCYLDHEKIGSTTYDLTLEDRIKSQYKEIGLCQKGCEIDGFDYDNIAVKCKCPIKIFGKEMTENSTVKISQKFEKDVESENFFFLTCGDLIFEGENLKENAGFYLFLVFFALTGSCAAYMGIKRDEIFKEFFDISGSNDAVDEEKQSPSNPPVKKREDDISISDDGQPSEIGSVKSSNNVRLNSDTKITPKDVKVATTKDKAPEEQEKSYCDLYELKIKEIHPILRLVYYTKQDIKCILIAYFLIDMASQFFANALLYNATIVKHNFDHQKFYDFGYNFGKILLAYLIGVYIKWVVNFLVVKYDYKGINDEEGKNLYISKTKKMIIFFFILIVLLSAFYWYFCSAFCVLFPHNVKQWVYNSLIGILIRFILPFFTANLCVGLYNCEKKNNNKFFYACRIVVEAL